ncbi:hypothetical protein BKA69DRAFT_1094335 [Paraphysoderma sedebokerense]|nr:hypothetical protein BKA69DRAFT_1094335 [Paraphysoderma sedebokerense]
MFEKQVGQETWQFVLESVFAFLNFVLWSFQLVPQIYHTYKRKTTYGVNPWVMIIWIVSCAGGTAYALLQRLSLFIDIQLIFFGTFCGVCLSQHVYYALHYSKLKSVLACLGLLLLYSGVTVSCYLVMTTSNSITLTQIIAISATVLLCLGFVPQYITILKAKTAEGLSVWFLVMDAVGGIFFALSLVFRPGPYDIIAGSQGLVVTACQFVNMGFWFYYRKSTRSEDSVEIVSEQKSDISSLSSV